jgi:hypothetical protein
MSTDRSINSLLFLILISIAIIKITATPLITEKKIIVPSRSKYCNKKFLTSTDVIADNKNPEDARENPNLGALVKILLTKLYTQKKT